MRRHIPIVLVLAGCFPDGLPPDAAQTQIAHQLVNLYGGLPPDDVACLLDVEIIVSSEAVERWCDPGDGGCYYGSHAWLDSRHGTIFLHDAYEPGLLQHEFYHRLLDCTVRDEDTNHSDVLWLTIGFVGP